MNVLTCSRRKHEGKKREILKLDYTNLLLNEKKKALSKSSSKLKMTTESTIQNLSFAKKKRKEKKSGYLIL